MAKVKYDPILGELIQRDNIPQLSSDPASSKKESAWVRRTGGGTGLGSPYGLLLALTQPGDGGGFTYEFRYRTKEGTTVGVALS
jgi:hypothetical protein